MTDRIPEICKEEIERRAKYIKPVLRFAMLDEDGSPTFNENKGKLKKYYAGLLYYIKNVDIYNIAFTCDPKPTFQAEDLEFLDAIVTYHEFGAPVCFKPSIAEVLAQIPYKYLKEAVAFETVSDDLNCTHCIGEYHHTITRLYKKRSNHTVILMKS